jgi:hypothetical protein
MEREPEQEMARQADEMEHRIDQLEEHLEEARGKAGDAVPGADLGGATGDVADEEGGPMFGDDPEGAQRRSDG